MIKKSFLILYFLTFIIQLIAQRIPNNIPTNGLIFWLPFNNSCIDESENKLNIEKIYGEQWDFCKCAIANDSLDKAVKAGDVTDKLMERFDEVDIKCKSFLVMDNTRTPEERAKHDKKIRNCLRAAGIR